MDSTRLAQFRKDFYQATRKQVEAIIGSESKELKAYRERYEKELSRLSWVSMDQKHLFARLKKADIVLVGDFHAQKQSSRGLLRLVRKMKSPLILAMECLNESDQPVVDRFMRGELSEKDFLKQVSWQKNWGFPWENYRPLFKWAQQHQCLVYGINSQSVKSKLIARDQYSATAIKKIKRRRLICA